MSSKSRAIKSNRGYAKHGVPAALAGEVCDRCGKRVRSKKKLVRVHCSASRRHGLVVAVQVCVNCLDLVADALPSGAGGMYAGTLMANLGLQDGWYDGVDGQQSYGDQVTRIEAKR